MLHVDPNAQFRAGLKALRSGNEERAMLHFGAALDGQMERGGNDRDTGRYLSYYGLSMALCRGANHESLRACQRAVNLDNCDADLFLNLARVYLMARKKTRAMEIISRGLRIDPAHSGLTRLQAREERRARPLVPMLHRDHPLNRSLGRLRSSLSRRAS